MLISMNAQYSIEDSTQKNSRKSRLGAILWSLSWNLDLLWGFHLHGHDWFITSLLR